MARRGMRGVDLARGPSAKALNLVAKSACRRARIGALLLALAGAGLPERRFSIATRESAINDVGAYGFEGTYTLELVSSRGFAAALSVTDGLRNDGPPNSLEITSNNSEETIVYPSANCLPACSGTAIRLF